MKREHRDALVDLQIKANDAEKKANRKKLVEVFGEYLTVAWGVLDDYVALPKCDKCDDQRYIHFKSPSGKNLSERCACDKKKHKYVPQELSLVRFYAMRKDRQGNDDHVERHYRALRCLSEHDEYEESSNIYNGEEFANVRRCGIVFFDKEKCQEYCDWLNGKAEG